MSRRRLRVGDQARIHTAGFYGENLTTGHAIQVPRGATGQIIGHWADHHVYAPTMTPPMLCLRIQDGPDLVDVPVDSDMAGAVTPTPRRRRAWRGWRAVSAGAMVTATIWTTALTVWATSGEDHLHVDHNIMHTVEVGQ